MNAPKSCVLCFAPVQTTPLGLESLCPRCLAKAEANERARPRPSVAIEAAGVFLASALGFPPPTRIDPPPDAAGQDERSLSRAIQSETRRLAPRHVVARDSAAWWVWLAALRERVAARVDANDVGDGLTPRAFSLVIAAGARAASAADEAMCSASEADMYSVAGRDLAAGICPSAPDDRWERKARGARLRALRSIERDAVRWFDRVYAHPPLWLTLMGYRPHPEVSRAARAASAASAAVLGWPAESDGSNV